MRASSVWRNERGVSAVEFALVAPILILFIVGAAQLGLLFFANADLRNAVASGARVASVFPRPDDAVIVAAIDDQVVGLDRAAITGPTLHHGTDANGLATTEISLSYAMRLDFIFFSTPPITLTEQRKVFTQLPES